MDSNTQWLPRIKKSANQFKVMIFAFEISLYFELQGIKLLCQSLIFLEFHWEKGKLSILHVYLTEVHWFQSRKKNPIRFCSQSWTTILLISLRKRKIFNFTCLFDRGSLVSKPENKIIYYFALSFELVHFYCWNRLVNNFIEKRENFQFGIPYLMEVHWF